MDFTNNLCQIAGKLAADLRERTGESGEGGGLDKVESYNDPWGIYSAKALIVVPRGSPLSKYPTAPTPAERTPPFICRFKCINGPEPSRTILALSLMKTLCGWIPAQQSGFGLRSTRPRNKRSRKNHGVTLHRVLQPPRVALCPRWPGPLFPLQLPEPEATSLDLRRMRR